MSNNSVVLAGDVAVSDIILYNAVTGVMLNITPQVTMFNIYESMNNIFIQGDMLLIDNQMLTNIFPLTGNEFVKIKFKTPFIEDSESYDKTFAVYEMGEKIKHNYNGTYQLKLISPEALIDKNTRLSKKFSGNSGEVVFDLLQYYNHIYTNKENEQLTHRVPPIIENTSNNVTFVSNWWSPLKCIQYIASRALNQDGIPSYIFFENQNRFSFVSLDSISRHAKDHGPYMHFVSDFSSTKAAENILSTSYQDVESEYSKIISPVRVFPNYNVFERLHDGFYGSEVVGLDLSCAQYLHYATDGINNITRLNKYDVMTDIGPGSSTGSMRYIPRMSYTHDYVSDISNTKQWSLRANVLAKLKHGTKLAIEVNGRSDYSIGQVVNVKIPKDQQMKPDSNVWDDVLSGNYLVHELKHTIVLGNRCKHTCVMNLCKDSYTIDTNI